MDQSQTIEICKSISEIPGIQCCGSEIIFFDPDPTFQEILDPDPNQLLSKEAKEKF